MPCSAQAVAHPNPLERARYVTEHLTPYLYRSVVSPGEDAAKVAWRTAPEPFPLAPKTVATFEALGADLLAFSRASNKLYFQSVKGLAPDFVREYLDLGKPEHIIRLQRQNRFKQDIARVIRPDIILTESGMVATELDSVPGGMGFVGAMGQTYCELGFDQVGEFDGIARGFARMAQHLTDKERPCIAIVVSDESENYRGEMQWLAEALRIGGHADAVAVHPEDLVFTEEALVIDTPTGRKRVDLLYRFFEMYDLLNVAKQELMLYSARHKRVAMTPPPKAFLEEKLWYALFHNPALASYWRDELTPERFERLSELFPQTWILDPRPLPPQAVVHDLTIDGQPVQSWSQLYHLSKTERQFVVKPSGFSERAWGSRGVQVADDLTRDEWMAVIDGGLAVFDKSPHILQAFHKSRRVRSSYFDVASGTLKTMDGRVRLCPFYFVAGDEAMLSGVLATVVPADKRIIHGMNDAIMIPCSVSEAGY